MVACAKNATPIWSTCLEARPKLCLRSLQPWWLTQRLTRRPQTFSTSGFSPNLPSSLPPPKKPAQQPTTTFKATNRRNKAVYFSTAKKSPWTTWQPSSTVLCGTKPARRWAGRRRALLTTSKSRRTRSPRGNYSSKTSRMAQPRRRLRCATRSPRCDHGWTRKRTRARASARTWLATSPTSRSSSRSYRAPSAAMQRSCARKSSLRSTKSIQNRPKPSLNMSASTGISTGLRNSSGH